MIPSRSLTLALVLTTGVAAAQRRPRPAPPQAPAPAAAADTSAAAAQARPARKIGLRDALAVAVRQNPTLQVETIDVAIAEAQILQARGLDDFTFDLSANWLSRRRDPITGSPFQQLSLDNVTTSAGLTKPLSTGGAIGLRFDGSYTRTLNRIDVMGVSGDSESEEWAPTVALALQHPLLRGFGSDVARAARRRALAARDVQTLEREGAAANIVRDVIQAYWELAYSVEDLEIRRQSLTLAQEQLRIVRARIQHGNLAPAAAAEVEATVATREEEILLAEVAIADRSLALRLLAGLEIGPGEINLEATDRAEPSPSAVDLDRALASAMRQNPQLRQVEAQGRAATIEVDVAENGLLPQLDFSASAGPSGNADDAGPAFQNMVEFQSYTVQAGIIFSTPLQRRAAKGATRAALGSLRRVKVGQAELRAQIGAQVVRAYDLVRSAEKRIEVLAKASEFAQVNLKSERARYEVGSATNFDVLRRQDELAQAQLRQARAKVDYLKSVAILEALTGDILPRYGVELAPK